MKSSKNGPLRCVGYYRVSTTEQAKRELSLPAQKNAVAKFCTANHYTLVAHYEDRGWSGTTDKRPEFQRMLRDILAPSAEIDAVVVYQTSRFMRDAIETAAYRRKLRSHGIEVIATNLQTQDDPQGRFMELVFGAVDQLESDINGVRTLSAMRESAKQGFFNGSQPPFGYRTMAVDSKGDKVRYRLAPNPKEVPIVREVFKVYLECGGAKAAARRLNQGTMRYRKGKPWTKDRILKIVEESAVVGKYYWGKRQGKSKQLRDESEWICYDVEPILDEGLFKLAQEVRRKRSPKLCSGRTNSSPMLLAGKVECYMCGAAMQLETGKGNRYYNCRNYLRAGREVCCGVRVREEKLDGMVLKHLSSRLFTAERLKG